jgi:hypothetical protein
MKHDHGRTEDGDCEKVKKALRSMKQQLADCQKKLKSQKRLKSRSGHPGNDASDSGSTSDSSGSYWSGTSSTSSSSSSSGSCRAKGCRCRQCRKARRLATQQQRSHKHKPRHGGSRPNRCYCEEDTAQYRVNDPSKGVKDKICGMSINGT